MPERPDDDDLDEPELFELPHEPESDLLLPELFELLELPQEPESDLPLLELGLFELPQEPESDLLLLELGLVELPHEPLSDGRDGAGLLDVPGIGADGRLEPLLPPPGRTMTGGRPKGPGL